MKNKIYSSSPVNLSEIPSDHFSDDGIQILKIKEVITLANFQGEFDNIKNALGQIVPKGVQSAADGAIQDPAGSAIGSGRKPSGGGASGAIYAKFPDLDPIPKIPMGASVFNTSPGPGKRVLHTYSPDLSSLMLKPQNNSDRTKALNALTNCYINVFIACSESPNNFKEIALVPVSGNIYAGDFINKTLKHLDPSYTITSIMLAQGYLLNNKNTVLPSNLYYYTGDSITPYNEAVRVLGIIKGE